MSLDDRFLVAEEASRGPGDRFLHLVLDAAPPA
jgi:hypothetical protein